MKDLAANIIARYELKAKPNYWQACIENVRDYVGKQLDGVSITKKHGAVGNWQPLNFDSRIFGLSMGTIDWWAAEDLYNANRPALLNELLTDADGAGIDQLTLRVSASDNPAIEWAEDAGFRTVTIFTGFAMELRNAEETSRRPCIRAAEPLDGMVLREITAEAFSFGTRFHNDTGLADGAEKLHQEWIDNCLKGEAADCLTVAEVSGKVVGYISFKIDRLSAEKLRQARASIGLFAVRNASRGKGIGSKLLMAVCSILKERGIERVDVGTEATNYNAINVYTKAGFKVIQSSVTMHRWRSRTIT